MLYGVHWLITGGHSSASFYRMLYRSHVLYGIMWSTVPAGTGGYSKLTSVGRVDCYLSCHMPALSVSSTPSCGNTIDFSFSHRSNCKMRRCWMLRAIFCASLLLTFSSNSLAARGMWGSKRKRDEDEDIDDISGGIGAGFEVRHKMASTQQHDSKKTGAGSLSSLLASENSGLGESIESMLNVYLKLMEELVESPDFSTMVTPETLAAMLEQIPGLSSHPEVSALLDSPAFTDPKQLKQTILQGMQAIRGYSSEIVDFFNSPEKINMLLEQLPEEFRAPVAAMMQGDMGGIKKMLKNVPGLGAAQQDMLMNLFDGNVEAMVSGAKKLMSDPAQTEIARQQFIDNPGMAEMFGISEEVVNDKVQFAALMATGMNNLLAGGAGGDDEVVGTKDRLHRGASMSA